MLIDGDPEILRLRAVLRDLVALSTIPATWTGREPSGVAAGLADALHALLQVDFAFVRLCDPGGGTAVDASRGSAWPGFSDWLEGRVAANDRLTSKEVVHDVGGSGERYCGLIVPVGVDAQGGLVAVASRRTEFPTEFDQVLLTLAANYAAIAFESARLIHDRRRAEAELREARDELEVKVIERTAELRRSEGYVTEAQRLAHIGSFALSVPSGGITHSSDEHSRLFGFDPQQGLPAWEEFLARIHPEDRGVCTLALQEGIRKAASFEMDYRIVLPHRTLRYIRALAHPVVAPSGELVEFVGTAVDVTERKRAEEEHRAQLQFFESLDAINRAMQGTDDLEQMLSDFLDAVVTIFGCDRAWLVRPSDRGAESHPVRMERTRPEYHGGLAQAAEIPDDLEVAAGFRDVLSATGPVRFDPESANVLPSPQAGLFSVRSMIAMAVRPKMGKPYMFGLHQCSHARVWTSQEERLLQEAGRRLADALNTLLMLRDVRESHQLVQTSGARLARLADEQAALRRVATLVARGTPPEEVFAAVIEEVGQLLALGLAFMGRYEPGGAVTVLASWGAGDDIVPVGSRWDLGGRNICTAVSETGRAARIDQYAGATSHVGSAGRRSGFRSAVGAPVIVEGELWGVIAAGSTSAESLPGDTEARLASFTELLATAISNAENRAALGASRARIVAAADVASRRIQRDLHDRAQGRIVSLMLQLRAVEDAPPSEMEELTGQLKRGLAEVLDELQDISRGIHPAVLSRGGLEPALRNLATRSAIPVEFDLHTEQRLPEQVEVAAYYVVSEALTNAAKHSRASVVHVRLEPSEGEMRLTVRDDGIGGAEAGSGSGLLGLSDRIESLGGTLDLVSPAGGGTTLLIGLPLTNLG